MQAMMERDATKRLTGRIEGDDAYLGGERNGGKRGRGSPGKTPIVAAVETTPEGKPIRLKLRRVKGFRRAEIATLARRNFHPASTVVSDGLHCFTGVGNAGCVHQPMNEWRAAESFEHAQPGLSRAAASGDHRSPLPSPIPQRLIGRSLCSRPSRRGDAAGCSRALARWWHGPTRAKPCAPGGHERRYGRPKGARHKSGTPERVNLITQTPATAIMVN
jgi:hypothetical protein